MSFSKMIRGFYYESTGLKMNVHSGTWPFLDRLPLFDNQGRSTVNLLAVSIDAVKETVYGSFKSAFSWTHFIMLSIAL